MESTIPLSFPVLLLPVFEKSFVKFRNPFPVSSTMGADAPGSSVRLSDWSTGGLALSDVGGVRRRGLEGAGVGRPSLDTPVGGKGEEFEFGVLPVWTRLEGRRDEELPVTSLCKTGRVQGFCPNMPVVFLLVVPRPGA